MTSTSGDVEPLSPGAIESILAEIDRHAPAGVVNCRATLERLDGDLELFRDLLGFYFRDMPVLLGEIRSAVTREDAVALRRWAHRLKGLVSNFDARQATDSASELEKMGLDETLCGAVDRAGPAGSRIGGNQHAVAAVLGSGRRRQRRLTQCDTRARSTSRDLTSQVESHWRSIGNAAQVSASPLALWLPR